MSKVNQAPSFPAREAAIWSGSADPQYWLGGDPFKTRFCDAMSTIFPEGERFSSLACVTTETRCPTRSARNQRLFAGKGSTASFTTSSTNTSRRRGIDGDWLEGLTRGFCLASCVPVHARPTPLYYGCVRAPHRHHGRDLVRAQRHHGRADPRMFALYAWHAMEEMEHKAGRLM